MSFRMLGCSLLLLYISPPIYAITRVSTEYGEKLLTSDLCDNRKGPHVLVKGLEVTLADANTQYELNQTIYDKYVYACEAEKDGCGMISAPGCNSSCQLKISYDCVNFDRSYTAMNTCSGQLPERLCPTGSIIQLEDVVYQSASSCSNMCDIPEHTSISKVDPGHLFNLRLMCDGRQACDHITVPRTNVSYQQCDMWHPSDFRLYKYHCLQATSLATACSGEPFSTSILVCPAGEVLHIQQVIYRTVCTYSHDTCINQSVAQRIKNIQMAGPQVLREVRDKCNGWHSCNVKPTVMSQQILCDNKRLKPMRDVGIYFKCVFNKPGHDDQKSDSDTDDSDGGGKKKGNYDLLVMILPPLGGGLLIIIVITVICVKNRERLPSVTCMDGGLVIEAPLAGLQVKSCNDNCSDGSPPPTNKYIEAARREQEKRTLPRPETMNSRIAVGYNASNGNISTTGAYLTCNKEVTSPTPDLSNIGRTEKGSRIRSKSNRSKKSMTESSSYDLYKSSKQSTHIASSNGRYEKQKPIADEPCTPVLPMNIGRLNESPVQPPSPLDEDMYDEIPPEQGLGIGVFSVQQRGDNDCRNPRRPCMPLPPIEVDGCVLAAPQENSNHTIPRNLHQRELQDMFSQRSATPFIQRAPAPPAGEVDPADTYQDPDTCTTDGTEALYGNWQPQQY